VKVLDNLKRNILDVDHDPSLEDYLDLMEAVKEKINSTEDRSKKLSLLTLAPNSWTNRQTSEYFGVSEYCAAQARSNKEKYGILSLSDAPSEKNRKGQVTDADKQRIIEFYTSDEYSRQLPGRKNVISVKQSNGKRLKIQKRLLLVNINEFMQTIKKIQRLC
jgi:RNase P/RNase MRP subunit p29